MKFDVVIIGGGLAGSTVAKALESAGLKLCIVSEGLSLNACPSVSCTYLHGDSAVNPVWNARTLKAIHTRNLGDTLLEGRFFVLATGKFFSRGLMANMEKVYEPIFGADVYFDEDRSKWYNPDFSKPQPFESYGVITDSQGRVLLGGEVCENLFAAGEVKQGSIDIVNDATAVAKTILDYAGKEH